LPVLVRKLGLELARLGQLCSDVGASRRRGGRWVLPRVLGRVSVTRSIRAVSVLVDDDHEALAREVIASDARVIGAAIPVVCGVEEPLEHHGVRYTEEIPISVAV
jgi:hypothetical protein